MKRYNVMLWTAMCAMIGINAASAQVASSEAYTINGTVSLQSGATESYDTLNIARHDEQFDTFDVHNDLPLSSEFVNADRANSRVYWSGPGDNVSVQANSDAREFDLMVRSNAGNPMLYFHLSSMQSYLERDGTCPNRINTKYKTNVSGTKLLMNGVEIDLPGNPADGQVVTFEGDDYSGSVTFNVLAEFKGGAEFTSLVLVLHSTRDKDMADAMLTLGYNKVTLDCLSTPIDLQSFSVD